MPGPFPYAPIQYTEQQTQLFPGMQRTGVRELWQIQSRLPMFFASATNKGPTTFWMGAAIARDASGSGFVLANNGALATTAIGLACLGAPPTQPEIVQLDGLFSLDDWTPVTGAANLTPLAFYWLDATSGKLTSALPTSPAISALVGYSISPRTLKIGIEQLSATGAAGGPSAGYGEIYVHDNAVSQTFANQNQYYTLNVGWVAGIANNFTADSANSRLICNQTGVYQASAVIDYSGPANQTFQFSIFRNGVAMTNITAHSMPRGAGQIICTTILGIDNFSAGDILDLRGECISAAGQAITVIHANLGAESIGGLTGPQGPPGISDFPMDFMVIKGNFVN